MTHTNSNFQRIFKKNEEEFVRRDPKRDKMRGKYLRNRARRLKEKERDSE